jgi:hypothetical protein
MTVIELTRQQSDVIDDLTLTHGRTHVTPPDARGVIHVTAIRVLGVTTLCGARTWRVPPNGAFTIARLDQEAYRALVTEELR